MQSKPLRPPKSFQVIVLNFLVQIKIRFQFFCGLNFEQFQGPIPQVKKSVIKPIPKGKILGIYCNLIIYIL